MTARFTHHTQSQISSNVILPIPGLSNLWQMAGRNYFFLKLAGQYTNSILLDVSTTVHATDVTSLHTSGQDLAAGRSGAQPGA